MLSTRSTNPLRKFLSIMSQWAANVALTFGVLPNLPGTPCRWDGAGACTAVIRGGGTAHVATAALAYIGTDGGEHLKLFRGYSPTGNARHAAASARLDAVEFILNDPAAKAIQLFIDDPVLRRELVVFQNSFPMLQLASAPDLFLSNKAAQAASRSNSITLDASAAAARLALHQHADEYRNVIATDASIVPGRSGAGISAVGSDGFVWQNHLPGTSDITWAEMKAIHAAITLHRGTSVLVLSDSQGAVAFANGIAVPAQARMRRLAAQIKAERACRDIDIRWVRAHNGHPLNEAADAMARQARHAPATLSQAA